jgi:hypothetical protein
LLLDKEIMTTFTTEDRITAVGSCGCGRSPTGKCIGWHGLTEDQYQAKQAEWDLNEYKKQAQELWSDSCTSNRTQK